MKLAYEISTLYVILTQWYKTLGVYLKNMNKTMILTSCASTEHSIGNSAREYRK